MWRSRRWYGVGAVAVAVVGAVALAWPAVATAGSAVQAGPGTLTVTFPGTVVASQPAMLTFSFSAAASPPPAIIVTLSMPSGWTASPPSSSDLTCPNSDCAPAGATGTQFRVVLYPGASTFMLVVRATPPGSAGPASFTATEVTHGQPLVTLPPVTSSPVNVVCPAGGLGTMMVDPTAVAVASSGIFTFTYTAGSCGEGAGGMVGVTVPNGWTSTGPVAAAAGNLSVGAPVSFTYGPARDGSTGPATFTAWQAASGGPTQDLASAPMVMVTQPPVATSPASTSPSPSSPSPSPSSPSASSPSASSPSPAGSGGPTTVTSSQVTVTVTPSHSLSGKPSGPPFALVADGVGAGSLALLAGLGGLLAARSLRGRPRRGGHGTGGGSVRAVPHAGPPPSVAVRDTGNRPTLTVRLEPRIYATVTTIKEQRP